MASPLLDANESNDKSYSEATSQPLQEQREALSPEDFYYDGSYLVFTEEYHLRRGFCCRSGCRHCPYGFKGEPDPR